MSKRNVVVLLITVFATLILLVLPAAAHEERELGDLVVEFGWRVEPALVGQLNGPVFIVHTAGTDGADGEPVEGATLQVTIVFGDASTTLDLLPDEENPGYYIATIIPTLPGDYTFEVTGDINGTAVDEVFSSADGYFDTVEPASDLQFPVASPSSAELLQMIQDLQAQIESLRTGQSSGG
ncbi:MAG: hypothetical protein U0670_17865 [Anaerolineae bacterium]